MSGSLHTWYSLRDLEALGTRGVALSGEIEISRLARLAELLNSASGSVKATLSFRQRTAGWLDLALRYETTLELTCQRCLEPMTQPMAETVDIALLESEALEPHVPVGLEPVTLGRGRLLPAQLIEDELIVALPLVPKHARIADCGSLARRLAQGEGSDAARGASDASE